MTLDDRSLREHLDRRAQAGVVDPGAIAEIVVARVAGSPTGPWWRRSPVMRPWSAALGLVAVLAIVAVVGSSLVSPPSPEPGASTSSQAPSEFPGTRALTAEELSRFIASEPVVGTTVVADVAIEFAALRCAASVSGGAASSCPNLRITLPDGDVYARGDEAALVGPPYAIEIDVTGTLRVLGPVRPSPSRLAWTMTEAVPEFDKVRAADRAVPYLYVLDAVRVLSPAAPPCPAPVSPPPSPDFSCGGGMGWLVPDIGSIPDFAEDVLAVPPNGLRVPNDVTTVLQSERLNQPAFWLVNPVVGQDTCAFCGPRGGVDLIARVPDLVELALDVPSPSPTPAGTPRHAYPDGRALTAPEFLEIVGAATPEQAGVVLIADVTLEPGPACLADADCAFFQVAAAEGDEPILVFSATSSTLPPRPYALRVRTDGLASFDLLGGVDPGPTGLAWTVGDLARQQPWAQRGPIPRGTLYLVRAATAFLSPPPPCPAPPDLVSPPPFWCGRAQWLVPDSGSVARGGIATLPAIGLRIPNDAELGSDPTASTSGFFLVEPTVDPACFMCTDVGPFDLLGQVRPIEDLVGGNGG